MSTKPSVRAVLDTWARHQSTPASGTLVRRDECVTVVLRDTPDPTDEMLEGVKSIWEYILCTIVPPSNRDALRDNGTEIDFFLNPTEGVIRYRPPVETLQPKTYTVKP